MKISKKKATIYLKKLNTHLIRSAAIVDLPLPEDPTTATILPDGRVRLKSFNIIF